MSNLNLFGIYTTLLVLSASLLKYLWTEGLSQNIPSKFAAKLTKTETVLKS